MPAANRENPEKVVAWLNEFQPVQAGLAADFNNSPISVEDLELWRKFRVGRHKSAASFQNRAQRRKHRHPASRCRSLKKFAD